MTDVPEKNETPAAADPVDEAPAPKTAEQLEKDRLAGEKAERRAIDQKFQGFGYVVMPSDAKPPILDIPTRRALSEWMAEMNAKKQLRALGMSPRTRVLLDGPPGCGKTTLGHHVAARMGLPMVTVMANAIISKYVGESAQNIGELFRAARQASNGVVLFFDEFDAIARNRAGGKTGHLNNSHDDGVTISLLAELDRHEGMVFAATNQPDVIDPAVQRRFNLRIDIGLPGEDERRAIVRLYMAPLVLDNAVVDALAECLSGASPALIKDMCEAVKRGLVLSPKLQLDNALGAIVRRATLTIKPHEDMNVPKLWGGIAEQVEKLETAAEGHWPPPLPAGA